MQQGYFMRAWRALVASDAWFGRICLLALVSLIPVFGQIVVGGYLLGWARDAAWGMDNPLPRRIFGNEDKRLYRRGFFALVIKLTVGIAVCVGVFLCMSLLGLAAGVFSALLGGLYETGFAVFPALIGSFGIMAAGIVLTFAAQFFVWVGLMRMSIYDTLGSGFQLGHIWAMIRRDFVGLLKIFFYELVASLCIGVAMSIVWFVVLFVGMIVLMGFAGLADFSGISAYGLEGVAILGLMAALLFALFVAYATVACAIGMQALIYRSLGYWTAGFDVASWGSQDDPLPSASLVSYEGGDGRGEAYRG